MGRKNWVLELGVRARGNAIFTDNITVLAEAAIIWQLMLEALPVVLMIALANWLVSLYLDRVSTAKYSWSIMLAAATLIYAQTLGSNGPVEVALVLMVVVWASRLALFLLVRDRNQPEDRRYRMMRKRYSPNFGFKSFYLIFMSQAVLAWLLSSIFAIVLQTAADSQVQWGIYHYAGVALWTFGLCFEGLADRQLYAFNRQVIKQSHTLSTGLWRYSRHPNYFGECCVWWAWFIFAIPSGDAAVLLAPLLMTVMLARVTGINLIELDIVTRRPDYASYQKSTSILIPMPPPEPVSREIS
jgi:steroid 5-alpha reductase family enzyme